MLEQGSRLVETLLAKAAERLNRLSPRATYRVQLHAGFTFRDAEAIAAYLNDLGISHLYTSPYLKATPGSTHGYDITDHGQLNPEIGTSSDHASMVATLRENGIHQILDIVPNHMGIVGNENRWWNDLLENGPASVFAGYFDISWNGSPRPELQGRILIPFLGEPYGEALEGGKIRLVFERGAFFTYYHDHRFPIRLGSYSRVLAYEIEILKAELAIDDPDLSEYLSILTAISHLPPTTETDSERLEEFRREKEVIKSRLQALCERSHVITSFIERNVSLLNGTVGEPTSFDLLDELLSDQPYRLSYWQVATDEINYRRFFDVNGLAGINMERPEVFEAAHALILPMVAAGEVDGLRIDHPDGLYHPGQYLRRLQEGCLLACARAVVESDPDFVGADVSWNELEPLLREAIPRAMSEGRHGLTEHSTYLVVEKILGAEETLSEDWPTAGTSGYEFLNTINGLFVDTHGESAFTKMYRDRIEDGTRYRDIVYEKKRLIQGVALASELQMLAIQLDRIAQSSRRSRDFTLNGLRYALREVIACFPLYRTYISNGDPIRPTDRAAIHAAVRAAVSRNPEVSRSLVVFIRDVLLADELPGEGEDGRIERRKFAGKFQQVTSPVTAKGVEDTAFYNYNRLMSLNEVGGEPSRFGIEPLAVHQALADRREKWPTAMSPLSTHDTKRSEDVRARINVLSEIPREWAERFDHWCALNQPHKTWVDDELAPDTNEEFLLYQNLLGAWPPRTPTDEDRSIFIKRMRDYFAKALHEAKLHTSWATPRQEYDTAADEFVSKILDPTLSAEFLADFTAFQARVSHWGMWNSLSQTLLRLTAPGVPDTYQGSELWDFSLVDPDNRRPVDYNLRRELLTALKAAEHAAGDDRSVLARDLVEHREDGRIKLHVTWKGLEARRANPELFTKGGYLPLEVVGEKANHLFAYARIGADAAETAIIAVPRLPATLLPDGNSLPLGEVWRDTAIVLPPDHSLGDRSFQNVFTGTKVYPDERGLIAAADLLADFPVALLV